LSTVLNDKSRLRIFLRLRRARAAPFFIFAAQKSGTFSFGFHEFKSEIKLKFDEIVKYIIQKMLLMRLIQNKNVK
jgi:hypothetical protein